MQYVTINSNTLANPYLYAISLDSFVPPSQIKQRFSRATSIQINFSNETTTDIESYLQALCNTISFKSFHFSAHQLPLLPATLWTKELISFVLKVKEKSNVAIEPPLDFENHLKEIEIVGASHIAPNLFDTPTLCKIKLSDIGVFTGFSRMSGATHLDTLEIYKCDNKFLDLNATRLTRLERLEIHGCPNLQQLPDLGNCAALVDLRLTRLTRLKTLANGWDSFQKLSNLYIDFTGNAQCNGLSFKTLAHLKTLSIHLLNDAKGNLLGEMPVLESVVLSSIQTPSWAPNLFESPNLKSITVQSCKVVPAFRAQLPPLLTCLQVTGCLGFAFPKGFLLNNALKTFTYDFPFNAPHMIEKFSMRHECLANLKTWAISAEDYALLEDCWFHGLDKVTNWATFSKGFFQLLTLKPNLFRATVHDNLRFLNPNHQSTLPYTTFQDKTVCFRGVLIGDKNVYKQKLIEIGFIVESKPQKETDLLIIGASVTKFPVGFWSHPHYFWSEKDLNDFINLHNPGFLQEAAAQEDHSIDNLRALLWSENVENELLALELMKMGGVPKEVLPDLIVLAKLYGGLNRDTIKKMIKPLLSANALKILGHNSMLSGNCFRVYQKLAPDFDVAQMIICYYKKGNKYALESYFRMVWNTQHHARPQMLKEAFDLILNQNYVRFHEWSFTAAELTTLLNLLIEKNEVKGLNMYNWDETALLSIFNLTKLEHLQTHFPFETIPETIAQLQELEHLELYANCLKTLPISLLNMNTLKKLIIYNEIILELPIAFKILETRLEVFDVKKGVHYY